MRLLKLIFILLLCFQNLIPCGSCCNKSKNDYILALTIRQKLSLLCVDIETYLESNNFYRSIDALSNNLDSRKNFLLNFKEFMKDIPSVKNLLANIAIYEYIDLIVDNYLKTAAEKKELLNYQKDQIKDLRHEVLKLIALQSIPFKDNLTLGEFIQTFELNEHGKSELCKYCLTTCCCCCLCESCIEPCATVCCATQCECVIL